MRLTGVPCRFGRLGKWHSLLISVCLESEALDLRLLISISVCRFNLAYLPSACRDPRESANDTEVRPRSETKRRATSSQDQKRKPKRESLASSWG